VCGRVDQCSPLRREVGDDVDADTAPWGAALSWTTAREDVRSVALQPSVGVPSLVPLVGDRQQ
jgi:hypothetical protein